MNYSVDGLDKLCRTHLVELKFKRRVNVLGRPTTRRMLATLDFSLLESKDGFKILHYKPPTQPPPYDAKSKGLITVWDLFFQDWRTIPVESVTVISALATSPPEKFWDYFNNVLSKMTAAQKAHFVDQ